MNNPIKPPTYENKRWLSCENVTSAFDVWQGWERQMTKLEELEAKRDAAWDAYVDLTASIAANYAEIKKQEERAND